MTRPDTTSPPPRPDSPRRPWPLAVKLTIAMMAIAAICGTVPVLWPASATWVHIGVATITPIVVEVIRQVHDQRRR